MTAFPIIETINCDVTEQIATNVISITDGQIYTNANLFKNGRRPAVDSTLSVSRLGSSAQFKYFKHLVGSIKNDLTNYRQQVESSQIGDIESEEVRVVRLKGRALESIQCQDQLDPSPIEETILVLLIQNKGFLNKLRHEEFNNIFFPYLRLLIATEVLYLIYIGNLAKSRISKKIERLIETFLIIIISLINYSQIDLLPIGPLSQRIYTTAALTKPRERYVAIRNELILTQLSLLLTSS